MLVKVTLSVLLHKYYQTFQIYKKFMTFEVKKINFYVLAMTVIHLIVTKLIQL